MGRAPCCSKVGLNRGAWTATEDKILRDYIKVHGEGKWRNLPKIAGLKRCGKSCRLRWLNYLRPDIKRGNITRDEEELIIRLHNLLGNRWSLIAGRLPGRTDNEIKNYWNTYLGKKLLSRHQSSDHDLAATSINTSSSDPSKTTSSNKILHKLPQPTLNKTTPSRSTAQQLVELPYSKSKTTTPNYVPAVRTKVHRLTKVTLLPDQDPQNPPPLEHDNSSKPAVDTVRPPPSTVNDKVNKIYANDQMVAGTGLDHDNDQLLVPVVGLPTEDESNNSSQLFMAHINQDHDHFEITEDDKKFLSDFLNVDCLDLELANLFGNGEHDSCNNIINKGFEDDTLLFSDQDHMALFGLSATELQSGTTSTTTAFSD